MNIATINVKDFGPIEQAEVAFDQPLCVIQGNNAQGKTSLINAVRLSLTPRCPNTDKKGGGAMDNIRLGAKKAEIVLGVSTAAGPFQIRTTYGPGASRRNQTIVAGEGSDNSKGAAGFEAFLDKKTEALSCVLDSDYFFNPKTEQKDILAALILPASHEFRQDEVTLAEKHLGKFAWDKSPVALIDQIYEAAYQARREAKAALGAIHIPQYPQKPEYAADVVQDKIAKCRAAVAKEAKNLKGGGSAQVGRIEQNIAQEREKLETARADFAAARTSQREMEETAVEASKVAQAKRAAAGRTLWNQIQEQIGAFDREIAAQQEAQAIYRDLGANPHCPTCTQKITKEFIAGKVEEHKKLEDESRAGKESLETEQQGLGDIAAAEALLLSHEKWTQSKLQTVKDVADAQGRITMFEKSLSDLEASLVTAKAQETSAPDTSALDAANAELSVWEARLSPALNYDATLSQIEKATERQQDQKAKVADLEQLCSYFGDGGIKAELIAQGAAQFIATVNSVLSKWRYEAKLTPEADSFTVLTPKGWLPTKQLSGFELLMFKAALQCAIAVHSKLKIVAIDEAQTMIDDQRKRLFQAVDGMCKEGLLEKAFIILADNRETAPSRPGLAYFRVQDGKVSRM